MEKGEQCKDVRGKKHICKMAENPLDFRAFPAIFCGNQCHCPVAPRLRIPANRRERVCLRIINHEHLCCAFLSVARRAMSLFSYLKADSASSLSTNVQIAQAMQTIADSKAAPAGKTPSGTANESSVQITLQGRRAAAEKDDVDKTALALASALRGMLDSAYASAGERHSADLTALSGRALAVIALNDSGIFSRAEIAAAKMELRGRDRQAVLAQINENGLTASSLAAYLNQSIGARATMSAEERGLRDVNPALR